jgi:hypothetical protein
MASQLVQYLCSPDPQLCDLRQRNDRIRIMPSQSRTHKEYDAVNAKTVEMA